MNRIKARIRDVFPTTVWEETDSQTDEDDEGFETPEMDEFLAENQTADEL